MQKSNSAIATEETAKTVTCDCVHFTLGSPLCGNYGPTEYYCSLIKGHDGDHKACCSARHNICRWPNLVNVDDCVTAIKSLLELMKPLWEDQQQVKEARALIARVNKN